MLPSGELAPPDFAFSLSRLRDELDQLFERLARELALPGQAGEGWRWGLEVEDQEEAVVVRAEAPGFEAHDFDLQVADNRLILRAVRKSEPSQKAGQPQEYREYYEVIALPPGLDSDRVTATYHNGLLMVTLPKTIAGKARKIPIQAG
jgi:HSP20 family protein